MAQPIEARGGEQTVGWKGLIPLRKIKIAGDDRCCALISFGDEVVEILVGGCAQRNGISTEAWQGDA